jgi:hypothetical protein
MIANAIRLCPTCLTSDAAFPLIPGCKSCREMLAQDEYAFWNTPLHLDEEDITPRQLIRRVMQPWRAFFSLIGLR